MTMDVSAENNGDDASLAFSVERDRGQSGSRNQDESAPSSSTYSRQQQQRQQQKRRLQQRFEDQAGIRPSRCWLEKCLAHIRNSANVSRVSVEQEEGEVWNQILHSDLRDVVREYQASTDTFDGGRNDNAERGGAATQLRRAIFQSKKSRDHNAKRNEKYQSGKIILHSDFRLLIQMEEIVDVAMNGEQQVAAMGGAPSINSQSRSYGGTDSGQQQQQHGGVSHHPRHRCLKMTFSDGYYPNGKFHPRQGDDENGNINCDVLLAIETSPILKLSVSSPPGIKLLLHGPIVIRVGLVELNDGNCAVIGGEIESWREVWKKAKERVQREKGLGIDPTVKALVWNPLMGDEEELDEGEGESGDAAAVEPTPVLQALQPLPPIQPVITPNQPTTTNLNYATQSSSHNWDPPQTFPTAVRVATNVNASRAFENGTAGNSRQRTLDDYPKKPRPETKRLMPSNKTATANGNTSRPVSQHHRHENPYQQSSENFGGKTEQSSREAVALQRNPRQHPAPLSSQNESNIVPVDDSPPQATFRKSAEPTLPNPYASLRPSNSTPSIPIATQYTSVSASATNTGVSVPFTFNSNPTFMEFKSILNEIRTNRTLYEQYYDKVITVPCKMEDSGSKDKVFNVVKAPPAVVDDSGSGGKKIKSKKDKKYEFFFVGKFFGSKQSDGAIACRVESSLLAPYFGVYSPAEIRKLTREDKDRVNRIVNQCMSQCIHDFSSLGQFQMKLMFTADEFTAETSSLSSNDWFADTAHPFLWVVKKI